MVEAAGPGQTGVVCGERPVGISLVKRESRLLLNNALEGLVLSIEAFNRPSGRGRLWAVLSALNHSLEQLLKAAIVDRGGTILDHRSPHTMRAGGCFD